MKLHIRFFPLVLGKFDARSDVAIFPGYASNSKAYRVYNKRTMCVEESVHIIFAETNSFHEQSYDDDFEIGLTRLEESNHYDEELTLAGKEKKLVPDLVNSMLDPPKEQATGGDQENLVILKTEEAHINQPPQETQEATRKFDPKPWIHLNSHPLELIICDIEKRTQTRSHLKYFCSFISYL